MNLKTFERGAGRRLLLAALWAAALAPLSVGAEKNRPVDLVNPLIDTANSRWFFFASACRPFGLVSLSPDTEVRGEWNSGYRYQSLFIRGFSHIHDWQMAGVPVMPVTGRMTGPEGSDVYGSSFSHDRETVRPGYHSVFLDDYRIRAEITSTDRVGFHRYTFPAAEKAYILFDLGAPLGPSIMADALARRVSDTEIQGYALNDKTLRRPKPTPVFFFARFNRPFLEFGGWQGRRQFLNPAEIRGKNTGAWVWFSTRAEEAVLLKVGISYVSMEQARKNLDLELPGWDFDRVAAESAAVWNEWLGRIEVEGGAEAQRTRFYTDLWHALLGRHTSSDVDGKYMDMTGPAPRVRRIPAGPDHKPAYRHFNSDAFWGAQWGVSLLWSLAYPEVMSEFCNWMVDMYRDGGLIPRGPAGGNYSFVMTGASSTPFLVSAYLKGIRDFDAAAAYQGMRKNHFPGGMMSHAGYEHQSAVGGGIEYYLKRGYIPERILPPTIYHADGGGQTLEYAYQDWCLAQMARELGEEDDYRLFLARAENYQNIFDPSVKMMRPRTLLGTWLWPFNPGSGRGWVEGNALQFRWWVPHDPSGLIQLMGGREQFTAILDQSFEQSLAHDFVATGRGRGESINYGNQPCMHLAHLFNYSGAPWLTQKWVREVKERAWGGTAPELGYRGDEDQGLLGSLGALMAIGLFDVQGGCNNPPAWQISSPIFDRVTIRLNPEYYPGGKFTITAKNNSRENMYIQRARLNGRVLDRPWFWHSDLVKGGELMLELGPNPNQEWGGGFGDAPPSMSRQERLNGGAE